MKLFPLSIAVLAAGILFDGLSPHSLRAATGSAAVPHTPSPEAVQKFEEAVDRTETLQLPINKAVLYRQAATALMPTDKPQAVMLLKRALADIDAAEAKMKAQKTLDEKTFRFLEFHRLPVIMLMERIDPAEALNVLSSPQTADIDMAFNTMFYERLNNPQMVRDAALHKMTYGVTPAVVAAYSVLKNEDPGAARSLGTAIVLKLKNIYPEDDPMAVQAAFRLVRELRIDTGALAPKILIDPDLLSAESVRDLFSFIADAFLASKDPEDLILGLRPQLFIAALEEYAPTKADDVKLLPFAAPDAKSKIFDPETPVYDANHPDPKTLKPEEIERRAAMKVQLQAQIDDSIDQVGRLAARADRQTLPRKERDAAVFQAVDQANKAISLARAQSTVLDREAFQGGELEFYNLGPVSMLVDRVSLLLQHYAMKNPQVAEDAAQNLDGYEIQTQVALGVAIREMTGSQPYLVPPDKPPAKVPLQVPWLSGVAPAGFGQPPPGTAPAPAAPPAEHSKAD